MIICHDYRYVFVKTRKTGGTSVEIALSEHTGPRDVLTRFGSLDDNEMRRARGADHQNQAVRLNRYGARDWLRLLTRLERRAYRSHMPAAEIRRLTKRGLWENYLTFTIARNPWEAAASAYAWHTSRGGREVSFAQFMRQGVDRWRSWPMYTAGGEIIVDEIIRYEHLGAQFQSIAERLGLPRVELPHAKGGLRRGPYQDAFGDEERRIVAEACAEEIEYFGWTFE